MNEQSWKLLISAYADGALSPDEAVEAERLLTERAECRAYLAEVRKLSMSLQIVKDEQLSPDCEHNILRRTQQEGRQMNANQWKIAATVCATVLVVVLTTQNYTKHGLQGRMRESTDQIGTQFARSGVDQYEPYYTNAVGQTENRSDKGKPGAADSLAYQPVSVAQEVAVVSYDTEAAAMVREKKAEAFAPQLAQRQWAAKSVDRDVRKQLAYSAPQNVLSAQGSVASYETSREVEQRVRVNGPTESAVFYDKKRDVSSVLYGHSYDGRVALADHALPSRVDYQYQYVPVTPVNTEDYSKREENLFLGAQEDPLSTFSIDVDTASYSNVRRFLTQDQLPPREAVRIEEMVNYFSYDYPNPSFFQPFSITTDLAACPWNPGHQLLRVGLKGKTPAGITLPASNLVFLIDVSGSMESADKLPLLKEGFKMMVQQLRPQDHVSIVTYSDTARQVLSPTSGADKYTLISAIDNLRSGGSTAGGQGIQLAYQVARQSFVRGGNNRVLLATDGDFNVGTSNTDELKRLIEQERKGGVFLTILGFGQGNIKDEKMSCIADNGNGSYFYIDSFKEAAKVLVNELGSTLFTIAKDVKIQVEFNPAQVKGYRLIGYEKRMLAKEDFNNDQKDAGEIGAGHTVTALYEIVPNGSWPGFETENSNVDPLKYQGNAPKAPFWGPSSEVVTIKLRYKEPNGNESKLITKAVNKSDFIRYPKNDFAWAAAVAEFGMLLSGSDYRGNASYEHALSLARNNIGKDVNGLRAEFLGLIEKARTLDPQPQPVFRGDDDYLLYNRPDQEKGQINFK